MTDENLTGSTQTAQGRERDPQGKSDQKHLYEGEGGLSMAAKSAIRERYQALFEEFNRRYFHGRLPRYRIEVVDQVGWINAGGKIYRRAKLIRLKRQDDAAMIGYLLHEMAHAATNDSHARKWDVEMQRLHAAGAPIFPEDLQTDPSITKGFVRADVEELLWTRPEATLRQFARWFVYERGHASSATALLRRYPWVRDIFNKAKKEVRQQREAREARRQCFQARKEE